MAGVGNISLANQLYSQLAELNANKEGGQHEHNSNRGSRVSRKDKNRSGEPSNARAITPQGYAPTSQVNRYAWRKPNIRNQSLPRAFNPENRRLGLYRGNARGNRGKSVLPVSSGNLSWGNRSQQMKDYDLNVNENTTGRFSRERSGIDKSGKKGNEKRLLNECSDYSNLSRSISTQSLTSEPNARHSRNPRTMGFKRLQELCTMSSLDVIATLLNSYHGFEELLKTILRPDLVVLVVKVLSKACDCEFEANKGALLSMVVQSEFLESVQKHLASMPVDDNTKRNQTVGEFISNLLKFFEAIMKKLPNTASEKLKRLFISTDMAIEGVTKYRSIALSEQRELFNKLHSQLDTLIEERERKTSKTQSRKECLQYMMPPDDFRDKSLYPTLEDLFGEKTPFIRPNIVEGAYQNVEDYLDIQFRLLREDFIAPLREGLAKYMAITDTNKRIRIDNVRMYRNVLFENPKVVNDAVGLIVNFDPEKKLNVKWEYSKRFMFGSLLLFTQNKFQSVSFGTVLHRDLKALQKGEVIVALQNGGVGLKLYSGPFLMVESEVYFEPYKHVMKALQSLDESTFPMTNYIVAVEKNPSPPRYILLHPECAYDISHSKIEVLNPHSWPDKSALGLDGSQYTAFQAALTEEFVVIQGPPGTGKTFLGLKIAQTLLLNPDAWNLNEGQQTPILVVCYTNHALDQFLEGLIPITDNIVRVGGQSRSEIMKNFNLRKKRTHFDFNRANSQLKRLYYNSITEVMQSIHQIQTNLEELGKNNGIVSPSVFMRYDIISPQHSACFREDFGNIGDVVIREWLLEGMETFEDVVKETGNATAAKMEEEEEIEFYEEEPAAVKTCDFDLEHFDVTDMRHNVDFAVDLKYLEVDQEGLLADINHYLYLPQTIETMQALQKCQLEFEWQQQIIQYWTNCLKHNHLTGREDVQTIQSTYNIWHLSCEERWKLYKVWLNKLRSIMRNEVLKLQEQYGNLLKRHNEVKEMCDLEIMQSSLVVGMTTTNAARLQSLLQALKPRIVIIEEAAEVLESHIVVSLTKKCEHVILIGDHQQLRPAPAVYRLAREFHLDVSLFERMVKNGLRCYSLENQHRMRPEISSLICPTIYPNLQNDKSVHMFPAVRGVTKSLFFIQHNVPEEEVEDIVSRKNKHEAEFLLALCRHLIWQGYSPEEITILATYKGQMFYMKKKQKHNLSLDGVNINVVDNFQGEENKIILLSLVRSNEDNKIGFLSIENRVCVALSRAKEGLYIIGNMDCLVRGSKIWPKIKETLEKQQSVGPHLTLQCQIHHDQLTHVSCAEDFRKVPEGGCMQQCLVTLRCGHQCESICHINNREHNKYKCLKPCQRIPPKCPVEHPCPKLCFKDCGDCTTVVERTLPCGHFLKLPCHVDYKSFNCLVPVEVELPACGHKVKKPCFKDTDSFPCPLPCVDRLPCGHSCTIKCHADRDPDHLEYQCTKRCVRNNAGCTMNHECTKMCYEECGVCEFEVDKKLPNCDHICKVKCSQDPAEILCLRDCKKVMSCSHICRRKCFEICGGCQVKVEKQLSLCGHKMKVKCCEEPIASKCVRPCERRLPCGHECSQCCGQPCTSKCFVKVISNTLPLCGHRVHVPCYLKDVTDPASQELLSWCEVPCGKELQCGHLCKGSCGECMQGRIHVTCGEKCDRVLICMHKCQEPCASSCPPCNKKCAYRCKHSKCNKKCGVPCTPCKERCRSGCSHQRCSRLCYELCDIEPCQEPCHKRLKCGHRCIGFCGDQCPPLCRICDKDVVTEIFFGREDEEDARFVYLVDCKHTFEVEGLENWMQVSDNEITLKTCPRCKSNILSTERYMNYVKKNMEDVSRVKMIVFGQLSQLDSQKCHLLRVLQDHNFINANYITQHSKQFGELFTICENDLQPIVHSKKGKYTNYLSKTDLQKLNSEVEILKDLITTISECIIKYKVTLKDEVRMKLFMQFDFLLTKIKKSHRKLSPQETSDYNVECKRFFRMAQLAVIESSANFTNCFQTNSDFKKLYEKGTKIINSIEVYSNDNHETLKHIIESMKKTVGSVLLSAKERKEIVQAVGVKKGAWYKCPNGHVYCIDNCGGAMQVANCPDCGEQIGGSQHRLLAGNRHAGEMDGSTMPAWPGTHY